MRSRLVAVIGMAFATIAPVAAQEVNARVGKLESEMRAVQRKVFPGGAGGLVEPDIRGPDALTPSTGTPASSPDLDLSQRVSALESRMATLTGDVEQNGHQLRQLREQFDAYRRATDAKLAAASSRPSGDAGEASSGDAIDRSGDGTAATLSSRNPGSRPRARAAPYADTAVDSATPRAAGGRAPRAGRTVVADDDAPAAPGAHGDAFDGPSPDKRRSSSTGTRATRLAAVDKPDTGDAPEDGYLYGYRLYQAKLYPEAEAQLKQVASTYPKSKRASYAQNLLGRSYLEDGKPSLASIAFYDNYKKMPDGDRAPDSLYYLAQALMKLNKPADACKVYAELGDVYAARITPEMKASVAKGRAAAKCA